MTTNPTPIADGEVEALRNGLSGVTPGPWYLDSIETDGAYGSGEDTSEGFRTYGVRTSGEKRFGQDASICDAVNSDLAVVHEEFDEDGTVAWDDVAKHNMAHIARCSPDAIDRLLAHLDATTARLTSLAEDNAKLRGMVEEVLEECEDYFDNRADADCDQDGFVPNKEMSLLMAVRNALIIIRSRSNLGGGDE